MRAARIAIAFVVSPIIGVTAAWLLASITGWWPLSIGLFFSMLEISYCVILVGGVPAYLLSRPWALQSVLAYSAAGFFVSDLAAVALWMVSGSIKVALLTILVGIVSGLSFGLIMVRTPTTSCEESQGNLSQSGPDLQLFQAGSSN